MKFKYLGVSVDTSLGTPVTPEAFTRSYQGEIVGKVDADMVRVVMPNTRKLVITFDRDTMEKFRGHSPGEMLTMTNFPEYLGKHFKIVRRDWKRCRVHLVEKDITK